MTKEQLAAWIINNNSTPAVSEYQSKYETKVVSTTTSFEGLFEETSNNVCFDMS